MFSRIDWRQAAGEVCLIMLGILAALAVDAWWDSRTDAATERAHLHQLLVDIEANDRAIVDTLAGHSRALDATTRLAAAFDAPGALPSCDTLANWLISALTWKPLDLRTGTHGALLATGEIRLIQNDSLRTEVIRYAGLVDTVTRLSTRTEDNAWASAHTFRRRVEFFWRMFQPGTASEPAPWSGCDFQPFRKDPEIREALFSTHLLHLNRMGFVEDLAAVNTTLHLQVASELRVEGDGSRRQSAPGPPTDR
jgi:hypothetical protein